MLRLIFALVVNTFLLLFFPLRHWRRRRAVGRTGWVHLRVDGPLLDLPRPRKHWTELLKSRGQKQELNLHRLAEVLDDLATDERARGLLVTLASVGGGAARLRSLRELLEGLRAQGKHVIVHLPQGASLRELTLAACADALWMDPAASIAPLGVAASVPYVKDALDRVGVEAEVYARGRYKTAAENLARATMSEPQRQQLGELLDDLFEDGVAALCAGRRVERERVLEWIEQSPCAARDALERGIVDALVTDQELTERLLAWPGVPPEPRAPGDAPPAGRARGHRVPTRTEPVGIGTYARRRRVRFVSWRPRDYVAVIDVHGAIVSEARPGVVVAAERPLVHALERARKDPRARAVLLHVDSRGGSALASARILRAVRQVRAVKPVVAYFCDVAASGGYMIGVGAQRIVAQPVTLTGSIGVVAAKPVAGELLKRLGVHLETIRRGERVDMFSPARALRLDEREAFERELELVYDDFIRVVAEGRGRGDEEIRRVAEGRVWSGRAALREGLIDRLGGFRDALEEARALVERGAELEPRLLQGVPWGGAVLGALGRSWMGRSWMGRSWMGLSWMGLSWMGLSGRGLSGAGVAVGWIDSLLGRGALGRGGLPWLETWLLAEEGCRIAAHCDVEVAS